MSVYVPGPTARNSGIPTKNLLSAEYLYNRLPAVYRKADQRLNQTIDEVLKILSNIDDSQVADEHRREFQLQRFLRIFGCWFDYIRTSIDSMKLQMDPELCEAKYLAELGLLIGWTLNQELPVDIQRQEVLSAIELYRRKGRATALDYLIDQLTDFGHGIVELKDRVLFFANPGSPLQINPDSHLADPVELLATGGTAGDQNYYLYGLDTSTGFNYAVNGIVLYLIQNLLNDHALLLTQKIQRVVEDFVPFGTDVTTVTLSRYTEIVDIPGRSGDSEENHDELWVPDFIGALRFWAPSSYTGGEETGIMYDPAFPLISYPLWYHLVREESWSHVVS